MAKQKKVDLLVGLTSLPKAIGLMAMGYKKRR